MDFLKAINNGQYEAVRLALQQQPDGLLLDSQDDRTGNGPLHVAIGAKRNRTKLIELLIGAGVDCDLVNRDGLVASEMALAAGSSNVAEFMMRKEFEGVPDDRAVYRLIRRGSVELLQIYLEKRAFDIHTKMKVIRRVVDELTFKGVVIKDRMKVFLEYQLVEYSYRYGSTGGGGGVAYAAKKKSDGGAALLGDEEAKRRIELILCYTKYLKENYDANDLNDLDDKFVLRLRVICECCHFLEEAEKKRDRKLFKHIPLAEITYLIGVFLAILKRHVGFEIYKLVLNKAMIMSYLEAVCDELRLAMDGSGGGSRQFQWTAQLLLDLIGCVREQRLARYVSKRKRLNKELTRLVTAAESDLGCAERELVMNEIGRKDFQVLREGVLEWPDDSKWCVEKFVGYLGKCEQKTIVQLWQQQHPKLRLSKRQVHFVMGRKELAKIRSRTIRELSKNKMKLIEKEINSREFQSLAKCTARKNRVIFQRIRKSFCQIRQMCTIKKIAQYIENVIVIDLDDVANESLSVLAIKRVLHLIQESIVSSSDHQQFTFAKMLDNILDHVLFPVEDSIKNHDVRDFFSQKYSLAKYFINKALDVSQYKIIQNNLRSVYRFLLYVINIQLIEAYKTFLGTAYCFTNIQQMKSYAKYIGDHNLHTLTHIRFDHEFYDERETGTTIAELKRMYTGMANELKLLSFIEKNIHFRFYHMQYHQTQLRVTLGNFSVVYRALRSNGCYEAVRNLLQSYLKQSYQKYDVSKSISISDSALALKELLRPYSGGIGESEETTAVVKHLEQLQQLMDPDRLFGINPVRVRRKISGNGGADKYQQFTRKILKELEGNGVEFEAADYHQLHEKMRKTYYENIFLLQNRYRVMQEFFRLKGIAVDAKVLAGYRERDEELLQELYDSKINDMVELLEKFDCGSVDQLLEVAGGELPAFVNIALEFSLMEVMEILTSVNVLHSIDDKNDYAPTLTGKSLFSYFGEDSLHQELFTFNSSAVTVVHALVFKQHTVKLYERCSQLSDGRSTEKVTKYNERLQQRWQWLEMQNMLFESTRKGDLQLIKECIDEGADLNGQRFGPLLNELCHYNAVDCAIVENLACMIDLLNEDIENIPQKRRMFLEYLLVRTVKSHFLAGKFCDLLAENRRMLVLFLAMFNGDVDLFLKNVDKYQARHDLHMFVNEDNHEFVTKIMRHIKNEVAALDVSLLHKVVTSGNLEALKVLITVPGLNLNATNPMKYTALNLACRLNLQEMVVILAGSGVDVNVMSEDEKLPVFWLIQYQHSSTVVGMAIDSRTDLTSFSTELCLLHKAIDFDNLDVVKYLIEYHQVDPTRIYSNCNNLLHAAASFNRTQILDYLLTIPGIRKLLNNPNLVKNTPLNIACKEGHMEAAKKLLEQGVYKDICGEYGLNALAFAMYTNSFKLMKLLFRYGAKISYPLSSDFQPINIAIQNRSIPMLKFLLRRGVDIEGAPMCFINAVQARSKDMIRILANANGTVKNINFKDEFCQTALHLSVERDELEVARELIRCGADINVKNRSGTTPLHLAVAKGNTRFVQLLLDSRQCLVDELNYQGETSLIKAVVCNNLEIVKLLLNNGASVERLRNSEPSVLLYLVQENYEEILDYLLQNYHFDPNERDSYGNSLLYVATQHNHFNIVKLLVDKYQVRVNPINHKKLTPLMIARAKEYKEIFSFLESKVALVSEE
ncbi:uncharacterized protein LOC129749929 isoform X2 [Uranotaenia lowii]|nr:uncharacterized protein LOC129749929 isoform X2 [Uranotaenia lowii]XP_055601036.1 uncharacterized protein LOC129749929 isoform X2 [Uranotaenia lowii]